MTILPNGLQKKKNITENTALPCIDEDDGKTHLNGNNAA